MTRTLRRFISCILMRLVRSSYLRLLGQRILSHTPRLRGLVLRLMYGAPLWSRHAEPLEAFDGRGEQQKRLLDDLQLRWERKKG